jgi:hypothetical protein
MFAFTFFWVSGEQVRTLHGDFSLPLIALRLIILVDFFPEKPEWVLRNGRMQE